MSASMMRWALSKNKFYVYYRLQFARQNQTLAVIEESSVEDSHYPKVKPKFPPGEWGEMAPKISWLWDDFRKEVAEMRTIKDKLDHLAERRVRTWKYNVIDTTPNLLHYQCGITKTEILPDSLPRLYSEVDVDQFAELLKPVLLETIVQEHEINRSKLRKKAEIRELLTPGVIHDAIEKELTKTTLKSLFTNLLGTLGIKHKDALFCHMDNDVTVSASWFRHGVLRNKPMVKPKNPAYTRQNNAPFYGKHVVDFQFRKALPLPEFLPRDDSLCTNLSYKRMLDFSPKVLGQFQEIMERNVTAGFNIGDPCPFNHLSVILSNGHELKKIGVKYGQEYRQQAGVGYILSTGFLSTAAQAFMQGFNYLEEITYPFTTQTILTDGRHFILSAYQLNTLHLWKDDQANRLQNICWVKNCGQLYEKCEEGKVVGFNEDVFKLLLKFLVIPSSDRNGIDLSPNVDKRKVVPDLEIPDREIIEVVEKPVEYDRH